MNFLSQQDDSRQLMEGGEEQSPHNWTLMTEDTGTLQGSHLPEIKQEPSEQFILSDNVFASEEIEEPPALVWISKPPVSNIILPTNQQTIFYTKPSSEHVAYARVNHMLPAFAVNSKVSTSLGINPPPKPSAGTTTAKKQNYCITDKPGGNNLKQTSVKLEDKSTQYNEPITGVATMTDEITCTSTATNTDMNTDDMIYVLHKKCEGKAVDLIYASSDSATSSEEDNEKSEDSWQAPSESDDMSMSLSDPSDTSDSEAEDEEMVFKRRCLEMTRKLHKENFQKYLGLPPDCHWVPSALAGEMKKRIGKIVSNQDIVEIILRKSYLNECFTILGGYYGLKLGSISSTYNEYHKFVISRLNSIGIRIHCNLPACCEP